MVADEIEQWREKALKAAHRFAKVMPVGLLPSMFRVDFREMRYALSKLEELERKNSDGS